MKTMFKRILVAVAVVAAAVTCAFAQTAELPELQDEKVRVGHLPNGLTYYIRHNEYPKGQADFHIAQKVGAVQEEEHQNGLAHFLEHMCFNGTKNFPGKNLLNWLESKGVKFGYNVNAHTGTDQTVYDIMNVPVTGRMNVLDSCLLILHDWADALILADEEIEAERGVIHEEWRTGNNATSRALNANAARLYPGTKYATHNIIGTMDVIDNFDPQVLRDYYEKWYRPDLQAVIVVGDIDVDYVEGKIKELFSPIKMPENPAEFTYQVLSDNVEPVVIAAKDKEMQFNLMFVAQKYDPLPREYRNTVAGLQEDYFTQIITKILDERFTALSMSPDAPFAGANVGMGHFLYAATKNALTVQAAVNGKGSEEALRAVVTELKRIQLYGFTASEYDRARTSVLAEYETEAKDFATSKNDYFTQLYIRHFLQNSQIIAVDQESEFMHQVAPMISVDDLNSYLKARILQDGNKVVFSFVPEKEGVEFVGEDALLAVYNEAAAAEVEPLEDNEVNEPLISKLPKAGKVKKSVKNTALGYTELTLSNGATVILKPTTYKDDEILLRAFSKGGWSLYGAEDNANFTLGVDMIAETGIAGFSRIDYQKVLSGKNVRTSTAVNHIYDIISGSSSKKDVETLMQIVNLTMTQPRENETDFNTIKNVYISQLENQMHSPQYVFQDSLVNILYNHHPKCVMQTASMARATDYKRSLQIYKERFSNAADFTFVIVGSFDEKEMTELVKTYIGSIPGDKKKRENWVNDGACDYVDGTVRQEFRLKSESNLAMLALMWNMPVEYNLRNSLLASLVGQLMVNNLLSSVREEEGAAYSPYSTGTIDKDVETKMLIQAIFPFNHEKLSKAEAASLSSFEKIADNLTAEDLQKIIDYMSKLYDERIEENSGWLKSIMEYAMYGVDDVNGYKEVLQSFTVDEVKNLVKTVVDNGNRFELIMLPELSE